MSHRSRTVGAVLLLAGIVLLSASAYSVLIGVGSVARLGGSGLVYVPKDAVIVESVSLLLGNNLHRDNYNRVLVRVRTTSSAYVGYYTVCIETTRGSPPCQTQYLTTDGYTFTFTVGAALGSQESTVRVNVYAAPS
jgi:hypothetical protein